MKPIRSEYVRRELAKLGVIAPVKPAGGSMQVEKLEMDKDQARELWQKYQTHRAYQTPHDEQIAAIYRQISRGRTVIRALESIRVAGLNEEGLPKLALMRADVPLCYWSTARDRGRFSSNRNWGRANAAASKNIDIEWPGIQAVKTAGYYHEATVPLIPVHLRPKRGIENYHILWEAEWTKRYPVDPYLIRRFGADAWLVVAAWDLTPVERAVMSSRLNA